MRELLHETADLAADYLESVPNRPVFPRIEPDQLRERLGGALPEGPTEPRDVVRDLAAAGSEGAIGISGGRYFGFRISVSSWRTTAEDIDRTIAEFARAAD